jgi:hypothetical protein
MMRDIQRRLGILFHQQNGRAGRENLSSPITGSVPGPYLIKLGR